MKWKLPLFLSLGYRRIHYFFITFCYMHLIELKLFVFVSWVEWWHSRNKQGQVCFDEIILDCFQDMLLHKKPLRGTMTPNTLACLKDMFTQNKMALLGTLTRTLCLFFEACFFSEKTPLRGTPTRTHWLVFKTVCFRESKSPCRESWAEDISFCDDVVVRLASF